VKFGRLKFNIKDYRTPTHPANSDLKQRDDVSPIKKNFSMQASHLEEDSENEFHEEEAVEIDCGVVDPNKEGEEI
jgi:hypothetical protein